MNRHSLYTKMVLFGCAVSIIPLIALGFFSYMKSSNSIQSHVIKSNIHTMNQINAGIEQILRTVDYTMNYVINTNIVQEAIYQKLSYRDFQLYNHLANEMSLLQSQETKVTDVILISKLSGWLVNNRGLYDLESYEYKEILMELSEGHTKTTWNVLETRKLGSSDNLVSGCDYTITLSKRMNMYITEERGVIIATIPACSLAEIINVPSEQEAMVVDARNRIIIHPDKDKIGMRLTDLGYISEYQLGRLSDASGQFLSEDSKHPISVTYVKSSYNDWTYISFTEMSEMTKESRSIGWFTIYLCLLIIGITVLFVWLGSRKVYSPIYKMFREISERVPVYKKSNKNEIQIINDHIRELFHSNTKLTSELSRNSEQIKSIFLHKMYLGNGKISETEDKLKRFGLTEQISRWKQFAVITLQIDLIENTRFEADDLDLLLFAINNIIEEMVPASDRLPTIIIDQTHVTLLGSHDQSVDGFKDVVYKLTENIQQNVRAYLDLDVSIGISLPFHDFHKVSRAYREGVEALRHRMKLGKGVIIPYSSLNAGHHSNVYFYPKQLENELMDAIRLADEKRAHETLKQWLDEVFLKDRTPHEYQISLICLLNEFMIVMQEAGISQTSPAEEEGSYYEQLLQLYISSEIETWFRNKIIAPMINVFQDRQASQYHNISEQIIDIIQKEYDKDLTLDECASRLHYNVFYLSSIFKKETGLTFSEYLANYRLNKAKKWLVETELPIKEIAERLTYNNPQNFIRYFRKQEGMTPGQYRKNYSGRKE
ncbi:helix-turn-helix domain-containing protein [Marinicrinis lubricantis]|uniref:Helix-turn-helix domain-containing protein n=1 Tax=Marinicrinis lubricantis TaxID=2086470 RepID=A0ABW1IVH8_9BACL